MCYESETIFVLPRVAVKGIVAHGASLCRVVRHGDPNMACKKLKRCVSTSEPTEVAAGAVDSPITTQRLLSMREVQQLTTYSRSSLSRLIAEGCFPAPLKLGATKIAYKGNRNTH